MRNSSIEVKVIGDDSDKKSVQVVAQRIVQSLRDCGWVGDIASVALVESFLIQCGACLKKESDTSKEMKRRIIRALFRTWEDVLFLKQ
jgi:3-deoxy-D-arabino-heptulosonate 7-phosphate (DAHP) synthase class II